MGEILLDDKAIRFLPGARTGCGRRNLLLITDEVVRRLANDSTRIQARPRRSHNWQRGQGRLLRLSVRLSAAALTVADSRSGKIVPRTVAI
jgi:hypothetical protein